jgi:hypothetical protein
VRTLEILGVILATPGAVAAVKGLHARRRFLVREHSRPGGAELDIHVRLRIRRGNVAHRHRRRHESDRDTHLPIGDRFDARRGK